VQRAVAGVSRPIRMGASRFAMRTMVRLLDRLVSELLMVHSIELMLVLILVHLLVLGHELWIHLMVVLSRIHVGHEGLELFHGHWVGRETWGRHLRRRTC
jgi:hypothetical protein